ncbi:virulence factor TspB C-terminal domain-related protein [Acinetobacter bereziniae]|uniref:virulence factor TspB C-terminal domain-related protein n=1 Tax=Acinetobacter bereziniae TaxID=106648 RepID=UPI0034CFCDEF
MFLLSLTICLTPSLTFAGAEKWVVEKVVYESVAKVVNVTAKRAVPTVANNPSYLARVPVTASATGSTVATMIRMGIAGAAIYGLIQGVGWIIENGVVKKPVDNGQINTEFYWISNNIWADGEPVCKNPTRFSTGNPAINEFKSCAIQNSMTDPSCEMKDFETYKCKATNRYGYLLDFYTIVRIKNQNYDPNQTLVPVSETELGDKVNNSPQAPQVLPDIYNPNNPAGGQAPELTSDALDSANPQTETDPTGSTKPKPNVDTDGDGKPDVYDPEKPSIGEDFTLPEFCSWAVTVCEWYKKYKEDSKQAEAQRQSEQVAWQREEIARQQEEAQREKERTFWQKVEDWFDWTKEQPDKDDSNDIEVKKPDEFDTSIFSKDRFSVSRQCPVPEQHTLNVTGISVNFSFDMTPICDVLTLARPAIVACSYLYAAYIVIGGARNG